MTQRKRELIRLVVGFVFSVKHYLRSEGGCHHQDLRGLLPSSLVQFVEGRVDESDSEVEVVTPSVLQFTESITEPPRSYTRSYARSLGEEENVVGMDSPPKVKSQSFSFPNSPERQEGSGPNVSGWFVRQRPKRRPTAIRVWTPSEIDIPPSLNSAASTVTERTPLIKFGVRPDVRRTADEVHKQRVQHQSGGNLGGLVEVGLPLVMYVWWNTTASGA